jgi:putative acetyltransferase
MTLMFDATHKENSVAIVAFRPELARAFAALNREWIERLFRIEESDMRVLRDPKTAIIDPGGQIFFALDEGTPVGTAAAMRVSATRYELAKMAVKHSHQGRGLGASLGRAVIEWVSSRGAEEIFLETNSALANAIRLYERLGFRHAAPPNPSVYARADVYMVRPVNED